MIRKMHLNLVICIHQETVPPDVCEADGPGPDMQGCLAAVGAVLR